VHFIFQPAEENEGGARAMIADGLFKRFPMDAVYSMHNWPGLPVGTAAVHSTAVMAAFDIFDLTLTGKGCHAAMPHLGKDALLAACQLVTQLPALIAREQEVHKPAVLSVTSFNAGDTYNVMPEAIKLRGTVRCFDMASACAHRAAFSRCDCRDLRAARAGSPSRLPRQLPGHHQQPAACRSLRRGADQCAGRGQGAPRHGAQHGLGRFSFMAQECPGVYIWLGNGEDSASLHNPKYDFNDANLPLGVRYWVELVGALLREGKLPRRPPRPDQGGRAAERLHGCDSGLPHNPAPSKKPAQCAGFFHGRVWGLLVEQRLQLFALCLAGLQGQHQQNARLGGLEVAGHDGAGVEGGFAAAFKTVAGHHAAVVHAGGDHHGHALADGVFGGVQHGHVHIAHAQRVDDDAFDAPVHGLAQRLAVGAAVHGEDFHFGHGLGLDGDVLAAHGALP
jgi:hypothetical protein